MNKQWSNSYLTRDVSQVMEKIVLERLLTNLEQRNLLTSRQHGFLKGRSTAKAMIQ